MKARDIMTTDVVSVGPTRTVAGLLCARRISAVPVLQPTGEPIGMVSEGDLIGGHESAWRARRDRRVVGIVSRADLVRVLATKV